VSPRPKEAANMRVLRIFPVLFVLVLTSSSIWAVDYKLDQTFRPLFPFNGSIVYDALVQPDGKIIAVGDFTQVNGAASVFIVRLNPDGTTDPTFTSAISPTGQTQSTIRSITSLPSGQFLITGSFKVGAQVTTYARLNANGSVDTTMPLALFSTQALTPLPDGKYLSCSPRTVGGDTYAIAHRLNPDGSLDPGFRITFATGFCSQLELLPSGKIMLAGNFTSGGYKPLQRLNADGSLDPTFDAAILAGTSVQGLKALADGRLLVLNRGNATPQQNYVRRLNADGSLETNITHCDGAGFLPLTDGNVLLRGCDQAGTPFTSELSRLLPDGSVDRTLDYVYLPHNVYGFRQAGTGTGLYVHGLFGGVNYVDQALLARLIPNTDPPKAKYDFDGDGRSDIAVYRPSNGYWYLYQSTAGISFVQWGLLGDIPAAMHFDKDGKTDITIFRDGILHSNTSLNGYKFVYIGQAGDRPMTGNFSTQENDLADFMVRGTRSGNINWLYKEGTTISYPPTLPTHLRFPENRLRISRS